MKKSILYILFALFSLSAAVSLTACKDDGVEISGANKSKTPKNVKLLEYGPTSLTICWDFIRGATSYTVQLVDGEMNPVSEALCKTTDAIDYHEFTDLATDRIYYGRVRANFPYSSTSDWVYVTANEQPAMLMASVGILELDPKLTLNAATGSTLTYEWSYTEDAATDATRLYNIELFRDEACSELHVSWLADGKLASDKGIFTALAGYPVVRFTFSGLDPETTYYARVTNASFGNIMTPVVAGTTAKAGPEASPNNPAQAGDIVLAQDFAAFIHGGDIVRSAAGYNAVSGTDYRKAWEPATGENPQADGDRPVCNWATEFHIHTGGTSAEYVESLGMTGWGSSGNTSTRPGYIKCGGGGGGSHKPTVTIPDDVPTGLNGDDHYAYIVGYPDSTVRPQNGITRAEVATIFFRLLTDETRNANSTKSNSYSDVAAGAWYNHAVSTLSAMGIVKGDSQGKFNPNAPITRAEFAAIAARFDDKANTTAVDFSDIASHWAKNEISAAANNGWINGYTDGTFRPNNKITRAEAMTLVNRVLKRLLETAEDLHNDMIKSSDNSDTSAWYYLAVQEATNSHYYDLKENKHEKWSKLRETRDWTELEK